MHFQLYKVKTAAVNVMTGPRLQHYLVSMQLMVHWCWNNRDSAKSRRSNLCPSLCDIISFPKTYPKSFKLHVRCSLEHNKATNQSNVLNRCLWSEKLEFTYATSAGYGNPGVDWAAHRRCSCEARFGQQPLMCSFHAAGCLEPCPCCPLSVFPRECPGKGDTG